MLINYNKSIIILFLAVAFSMLSGCNDFEEINTDPTRMTNIDAASLLTQAIYSTGTRSRTYGDIGNYIGQYWTNTSLIDQRHRYDFRGSDSEEVYNAIYGTMYDIYDLKTRAMEEGLDDYLGAGLVLEAYLTTYLTDVFGPVPYTEAVEGDQMNFTPKFDEQELIYRSNIDSLDKAYDLLATQPGGNFIRGGDVFYMGDNLLWRKLVNSLKLKMYLKMVKVDPSVASMITQLIQQEELLSSMEETCAIVYDGRFGLESTQETGTPDNVALGETFANKLQAHLDPRRSQMAILGVDNEDNPVHVDAQGNPIYLGVPSGENPDIIRTFQGLSTPYLGLNGVRAPSILMSHAEVEFYLAEAILSGYVSGDASAHYLEGIRSSCQWWGVSEDDINTYLSQAGIPLSQNTETALQQIWDQEYINFYYQGYDGWLNYRRVGYPEFHIGSAMLTDEIMKRMVYPPLLKSVNTANYQEAIQWLNQGDNLLSESWWGQ